MLRGVNPEQVLVARRGRKPPLEPAFELAVGGQRAEERGEAARALGMRRARVVQPAGRVLEQQDWLRHRRVRLAATLRQTAARGYIRAVSRLKERLAELRVGGEEDHIRRVASQVMRDALQTVADPEGAGALFAACDSLSTETYERTETNGTLLLCGRGHPSIEVLLEMTEPVPLRRTRAARKLLQMSRAGVQPLCDASTIWGLGRVAAPSERSREDLFEVRFSGRSRWEFRHAGECLFVVENRRPMLPHPPIARDRFEALVRDVLPGHDDAHVVRMWAAVSSVLAAGCGTTLVISASASVEARRLSAQGTRITPRVLEEEVLQAATGIGGAFLLDPAGVCHAIGVILDGVATAHGDAARGSRFNSAASYVTGRSGTIAIVISDDGSVDLFAA